MHLLADMHVIWPIYRYVAYAVSFVIHPFQIIARSSLILANPTELDRFIRKALSSTILDITTAERFIRA